MCGLAGIQLYPTEREEEKWQEIRQLFTRVLICNEERGRDSAGVAVIQSDGSYRIFKQPVPASDLVKMKPYQEVLDTINAETVCILGHTRMPTKGSRWNNNNNHPLLGEYTLGVHNGRIHNDDALFDEFNFPRRGEVDSEIIFRLLDRVSPTAKKRYPAHVRESAALLRGKLASLYIDLRDPAQLIVIKRDNPLSLHYEPSLQALFFSSRYLFLRKAFGLSVIGESLENESVYFSHAKELPAYEKEPLHHLKL